MDNPYKNDIINRIGKYFEEFKLLFKGSVDEQELNNKIKEYKDNVERDVSIELNSDKADIKSLLRWNSYALINQEFTKFYEKVEEYFSK